MPVDPLNEWVTLDEAAALLRVSKVVLNRWIKQSRLAAHHLGPRKVRLRRQDVEAMFTTVAPLPYKEIPGVVIEQLTPEQKAEQLAVVERLRAFQKELTAKRGGRRFSSSVPIINRSRLLRSKQLLDT